MKILVTGGSGYLGTQLVRHFAADDLSRRAGKSVLLPFDLDAVGEYDVVIHLAALLDKSPENADDVFSTNVEGTVNVLKRVREGGAFIFASTKDVYGRFAANQSAVPETCPTLYSGQTALEWSKLIAEQYVAFYAATRKFRACIFRMSTVFAPASAGNTPGFVGHYANAIDTGEPIRLPAEGRPVRDILHVDDLAAACSAFADSIIPFGLYNLGGGPGNALSLRELVERMEKVSGLQAILDDSAPLPPPVPYDYVSDLSLIGNELGWRPSIGIDQGLRTLFRGI